MRAGFTLIEILIVATIMVIAVGGGMLFLINFRSGQNVDSAARKMVAVLQSAQEKAIGAQLESRWGVYFDTAGARDSYYLFQVNEISKATPLYVGIPGEVIDRHTLSSRIQLVMTTPGITSTVVFAKATGRPDAIGTIQITGDDGSLAKNVTIGAQGRIDY